MGEDGSLSKEQGTSILFKNYYLIMSPTIRWALHAPSALHVTGACDLAATFRLNTFSFSSFLPGSDSRNDASFFF